MRSVEGMTSYEAWAGRKPSVSHLVEDASPPSTEPDLDAEHDEDALLRFHKIKNVLGPLVVPAGARAGEARAIGRAAHYEHRGADVTRRGSMRLVMAHGHGRRAVINRGE
jgi:hypothetical protein